MKLNSVFHNRKTETCSACFLWVAFINSVKPFKNMSLMFGSNTDTCICNWYFSTSWFLRKLYFNLTSVNIVSDCIITNIINNLINITLHTAYYTRLTFNSKSNIFLCRWRRKNFCNLVCNSHKVYGFSCNFIVFIKLRKADNVVYKIYKSWSLFTDVTDKLNIL